MKNLVNALFITTLVSAASAVGAVNTYQVTGPVLELTPDKIVVQKGKERWEVARDGQPKTTGDLKVGGKATVTYRMLAVEIEGKGDKTAAKKEAKGKKKAE